MTLKSVDWSNDAENSALITGMNYILKRIKRENRNFTYSLKKYFVFQDSASGDSKTH